MKPAPTHWPYPGARWWKFDLHTHTPASTDYGKGPDQVALRQITSTDWLLGYMRAGIDCVAVTDHNSGEWIAQLQHALGELESTQHEEFRPLHIFPGVEITANGGVHILAILDSTKTATDVAQLLGAVNFHGSRGASDAAADSSPIQVVEAIAQSGGLPVLAHVDGAGGAFKVLNGSTLAPLMDSPQLFAMEVCAPTLGKPDLYRQRKLVWAEVLGSDAHHPNGAPGQRWPGSHFTWVKMATPSLEGLRLALLDGNGVSIRRSDGPEPAFDPLALPENFIESIEIANARYMGRGTAQQVEFSPWFNALIGGRGTGKSTVVHFMRLAYRRESELNGLGSEDQAVQTFERFNRKPQDRNDYGGLDREHDRTEAVLTVMRDGVRHRLRWRQDGSGHVIEQQDRDGWSASSSQEVTPQRFPVRLFSQGQIAALAYDGSQALLILIDEAVGAAKEKEVILDAERRFLALRANIRELGGKLSGQQALTVQLEDVRRKIARFEQAHHADVLKAYQQCSRQELEINRRIVAAEEVAQRVEVLADGLVEDDLPAGLFDPNSEIDQEAIGTIQRLAEQIRLAGTHVRASGQALRSAAEHESAELPKSNWYREAGDAKRRYAELIEVLKAQGVSDPSEFGKLVQERQRLETEVANLDSLKKQRDQLVRQAQERMDQLMTARQDLSRKREIFLKEALATNPYVRIYLEPYGRDARTIERSFREMIGVTDDRFGDDILVIENDRHSKGALATLIADLSGDVDTARAQIEQRVAALKTSIEESCCGLGKLNFGGHFSNYLAREFKNRPEFLDRVLTWYPEDSLKVEYSPKGDGRDFRPIGQASAGQRAAAMLAFLLAYGVEPIVLDQPEDDLDNHLIYDLVVQQIRSSKQRRQIIVITHNANIVVNGDAEMLHAVDFWNGQCAVVQKGCLQERDMREEVCRVMEGGREAFEKRYRRLGSN
jgi:DNA repair ATPase RecN